MRRTILLVSAAATAALTLLAQPPAQHTNLKAGDEAPDFTLPDNNNKPVKLSDFRGKKNVVLAFFPAAFTGG
jgi:peroxiredoxin